MIYQLIKADLRCDIGLKHPGLTGTGSQGEYVRRIRFSRARIIFERTYRYIRAALLLHLISIIGFAGSLLFAVRGVQFMNYGWTINACLFFFFAVYSMSLIFFSQFDAMSRYQNYKQAKDLFFENGFKLRIANLYAISRCQRDAVKIAARDLGIEKQLIGHYKNLGYRWYHLLPDFIFKRPNLIFTKKYWQRTLFVKKYYSKHFYW